MSEYGYDLAGRLDCSADFAEIGSPAIMADVVFRRITTPRGSMLSAPSEVTTDIRGFLSATFESSGTGAIESAIRGALEDDDRVASVQIKTTFSAKTRVCSIAIVGNGSAGPFSLTLSVDALTLDILTA